MKHPLIILFLVLALNSQSQNYSLSYSYFYQNKSAADFREDSIENKKWNNDHPSKGRKTVTTKYKVSKDSIYNMVDSIIDYKNSQYRSDSTEEYHKRRKGKLSFIKEYFYYQNSRVYLYKKMANTPKESRIVCRNYERNKLTDETIFNGDSSEIIERNILRYDEAGNNISSTHFNGNKQWYRREYSYEFDSAKKQTLYFYKNQLYRTFNYECKNYGVAQKPKQKDTTSICEHIEYDSLGRKMRVNEQLWGGKTYRAISFYNKLDQPVEYIYYNDDNEIVYRLENIYIGKELIKNINYKKGGKEIGRIIEYKHPNKLTSETYIYTERKHKLRLIEFTRSEIFLGK
jgi:hypothetical protein